MAKVRLRAARTTSVDPAAAADDLLDRIGSDPPKLVVMFASHDRDHRALNRAVRARLPAKTRLIGATTGGEIDNDGMHAGSVVLAALSGDFDVGIGLGAGLTRDAFSAGANAMARACDELGIRPADASTRKHVGLVIDDAFRFKKEELLLGMLDKNQSMSLVGGGASDDESDPAKQTALIHVDCEVIGDAALIALFSTDAPWAAMRSHWYLPTGQTLRITKVDPTHMRALEIDGKPAAARYAEMLGVTPDDLEFGKPRGFATKPTALRVGREYFIRAPWKPLPDGSILFANLLEENVELELMVLGDMVASTKRFFEEEIPRRVPSPQAALFFHCSGRKWFAESTHTTSALSSTFRSAPSCAGLNVHFEIYCGFHINTTLTALAFGEGP